MWAQCLDSMKQKKSIHVQPSTGLSPNCICCVLHCTHCEGPNIKAGLHWVANRKQIERRERVKGKNRNILVLAAYTYFTHSSFEAVLNENCIAVKKVDNYWLEIIISFRNNFRGRWILERATCFRHKPTSQPRLWQVFNGNQHCRRTKRHHYQYVVL